MLCPDFRIVVSEIVSRLAAICRISADTVAGAHRTRRLVRVSQGRARRAAGTRGQGPQRQVGPSSFGKVPKAAGNHLLILLILDHPIPYALLV
jgi:hypothetical protein